IEVDGETVRLTRSETVIPANAGVAIASGILDVSENNAGSGGNINVLGEQVALVSALVNASGPEGGGEIRIGGGYQGQESIPNALRTYISPNSRINVRSNNRGNGGQAIVWANEQTQFLGHIDARGGSQIGNGGFVEISGKESLLFDGDVNLEASQGSNGSLLLDPGTVIIDNSGNDDSTLGAVEPNRILQSQGDENQLFSISANRIEDILNSGNVDIAATQQISVIEDINAAGNTNNLTLEAPSIEISTGSISLSGGDINLTAVGNLQNVVEGITLGSPAPSIENILISNGGNITLTGPKIELNRSLSSNGGNITFDGPVFVSASTDQSPTISSGSGSGNIQFNNTLDSLTATTLENMVVTSGEGNITFQGAIGNINPLGELELDQEFSADGNAISLTDFSGTQLEIDSFGDIIINATGDISSKLLLASESTQDNINNVTVETQGSITLTTDSKIGESIEDINIQLTARNGSITVNSSNIQSNAGNLRMDANSIEVLSGSILRSQGILDLNTRGDSNFVNILNSRLDTDGLTILSPEGIVTLENSAIGDPSFSSTEDTRIDAKLVNIRDNARLQSSRALSVEAAEAITVESSAISARQGLSLLAGTTVDITDDTGPSVFLNRENLVIRGNQGINIQNLTQPQSAFRSEGNITLQSDGTIQGQGRFINGRDFSVLTLTDTPGDFSYIPSSSDGVISSVGSVSFGSYEGSALKVEVGGDIIVDGDINITGSNEDLRGTDSDIAILSTEPALILRAGLSEFSPENTPPSLNERRNETTILSSRTVSGTRFEASDEMPSGGNITVGNIDTNAGPVILSATGDITTGGIFTGGDDGSEGEEDFSYDSFGGYVDLSAGGNIEVSIIDTSGNNSGDVSVNAGGTFRATGTFLKDNNVFLDTGNNINIEGVSVLALPSLLTSIDASGTNNGGATIDIQHGGSSLIVGPAFQRDDAGEIIYREFSPESDPESGEPFIVLRERVFPTIDAEGNIIFENEAGEKFDDDDDVTAEFQPVSSDDPNVSFIAGAIRSNQNNENLVVSVRDKPIVGAGSVVVGNGRITVTSTLADEGDPGSGGSVGPGDNGTIVGGIDSDGPETENSSTARSNESSNTADIETRNDAGSIDQNVCQADTIQNTANESNEASQDIATRSIDDPCVELATDNLLTIDSDDVNTENICRATEIVSRGNDAAIITSTCQSGHRSTSPSLPEVP
ncbi:MAG: hypothetical protein AAFY72_08670, partial [Cyanobacteria bacterium J06649_4]